MMAWANRIYVLIIKVNKFFSLFSSQCFLKEIENMFSVFLSSYRNTRESVGELEKAVETLAYGSCSHSISRSPKLPLVFLQLNTNTVHVFYFLNNYWGNAGIRQCDSFVSYLLVILFIRSVLLNTCLEKRHESVISELVWPKIFVDQYNQAYMYTLESLVFGLPVYLKQFLNFFPLHKHLRNLPWILILISWFFF